MKTTIFGSLLEVPPEQDAILRRLIYKKGFRLRLAFSRLGDGLSNLGTLERHDASDTPLPLRHAKDAVEEPQDLIHTRHQTMKEGRDRCTQRVQKTRERLTALRTSPHLNAPRLAEQERKRTQQAAQQAFYQPQADVAIFPPVAFGTKKRWSDRFRTLDDPIAEQRRLPDRKDAWEKSRNGRRSAREDGTKKAMRSWRWAVGGPGHCVQILSDPATQRRMGL